MSISKYWVAPVNFSFIYKGFKYKVHAERIKVKDKLAGEIASKSWYLTITTPEGILKAKFFLGINKIDKEFEPELDWLLKKHIFFNDHFREKTTFDVSVDNIKHVIKAFKISEGTIPGGKNFKLNWSLEINNGNEIIHAEFFPNDIEMFDVPLHPKIKEAILNNLT